MLNTHRADPYGSQSRRQKKMRTIDELTVGQREVVHEFGWNIVKRFLELGITKPSEMRGFVRVILQDLAPPWYRRETDEIEK